LFASKRENIKKEKSYVGKIAAKNNFKNLLRKLEFSL
jgi:hypothetical protein